MLWHVAERTGRAKTLDKIIVATSQSPDDDPVAAFCAKENIECFRGSNEDVLDRYYQAARRTANPTIVRVTADCPLLDPGIVDEVVKVYEGGAYDYVSNIFPRTYPDGLDVEVFSLSALERAWLETKEPSDREHVTPYMREQANHFRVGSVMQTENLSHMRWTVDYLQDLRFVRAVYDHLKSMEFGFVEVRDLLKECPELLQINSDVKHREFDR